MRKRQDEQIEIQDETNPSNEFEHPHKDAKSGVGPRPQ
jgi:hypothetical protein